ncbi:alginate lyase family protein [Bacillus cereus group sp. MYBKT14-1]|uniref:alginate lyase family protein n=1 Tax=unclassified Bacillus cereus group TaxID=2750818 RepID=UPI002DBC92F0|nr:alginate lyase family protein [Bacillus cereus]
MPYYLKKVKELTPKEVVDKVNKKVKNKILKKTEELVDRHTSTYSRNINGYEIESLLSEYVIYNFSDTEILQIREITSLYLNHYFDLLGSGWENIKYNMDCKGIEEFKYKAPVVDLNNDITCLINEKNREYSKYLRNMISTHYIPIDWRLDFKSGYYWDSHIHYSKVSYGKDIGVDVKVPWELSRMQHLVQYVWAYLLAKQGKRGFEEPKIYVKEFQDEVLDFISMNPPKFGVNWVCTMDVAIRAANWLLVYDLFRVHGVTFSQEFQKVFSLSIYDHGKFIYNHLERDGEVRNNHYYSNIVGLFFIAAYLPVTGETKEWLCFAFQENIQEMQAQFYKDGANFEQSTAYHRLSGELALYATSLGYALSETKKDILRKYSIEKHLSICKKKGFNHDTKDFWEVQEDVLFPDWYIDRLEKIAEFTMDITKPDKEIIQFGDNDSGRFFKIQPIYQKMYVKNAKELYLNLKNYNALGDHEIYWDEKFLDHRYLVAGINAFFERADFYQYVNGESIEYKIVKDLIKGRVKGQNKQSQHISYKNTSINLLNKVDEKNIRLFKEKSQFVEYVYPANLNLIDNLKIISYPEFGMYIYTSNNLYLAIKCGPLGSSGKGSHDHNDQLSIELTIDGKEIIKDPGTYLYTAIPEKRNLFRSTGAHFTIQMDNKEQNDYYQGLPGLFMLKENTESKCLEFDLTRFIGCHSGFGEKVYRVIDILHDRVVISDYGSNQKITGFNYYSNGYGKITSLIET